MKEILNFSLIGLTVLAAGCASTSKPFSTADDHLKFNQNMSYTKKTVTFLENGEISCIQEYLLCFRSSGFNVSVLDFMFPSRPARITTSHLFSSELMWAAISPTKLRPLPILMLRDAHRSRIGCRTKDRKPFIYQLIRIFTTPPPKIC